jgi:hypothetical protein
LFGVEVNFGEALDGVQKVEERKVNLADSVRRLLGPVYGLYPDLANQNRAVCSPFGWGGWLFHGFGWIVIG